MTDEEIDQVTNRIVNTLGAVRDPGAWEATRRTVIAIYERGKADERRSAKATVVK